MFVIPCCTRQLHSCNEHGEKHLYLRFQYHIQNDISSPRGMYFYLGAGSDGDRMKFIGFCNYIFDIFTPYGYNYFILLASVSNTCNISAQPQRFILTWKYLQTMELWMNLLTTNWAVIILTSVFRSLKETSPTTLLMYLLVIILLNWELWCGILCCIIIMGTCIIFNLQYPLPNTFPLHLFLKLLWQIGSFNY